MAKKENPLDDSTALLEVPLGAPVPLATWGIHLDTRLTPAQSGVLRRLTVELDRQQATLAGGRRVASPTDAIKWILDQLAEMETNNADS